MKTTTFDELLSRVLMRSGRDTDSPTIADYPDIAEMLNLRLQEIWDYPGGGWDFLKEIEEVAFATDATYRTIDVSDGRTVLGVYASDPREDGTPVQLRSDTFVGGELRLQADAPDAVWVVSIAVAPDWIEDSPLPEDVYQVFASAAISLTYADILMQESGNEGGKFSIVEGKGYKRLDELCERYAIMNTQGGRIAVRR